MATLFGELYGRRRLDWIDSREYKGYRGERHFHCAHSYMTNLESALQHATFINMSGDDAPICIRTAQHHGGNETRKDWGVLSAYYETPRQVGKMRLTMSGLYTYALPKGDGPILDYSEPKKKMVRGEAGIADSDSGVPGLVYIWRPTVKSGPYPIIHVLTAAYRIDVDATLAYIGTTNAQSCPRIFGADADELLMLSVDMGYEYGDNIVGLDYQIAYNNEKWSKAVTTRMGAWIVIKRPVFEWSTTSKKMAKIDEKKKTLEFLPQIFSVQGGELVGDDSEIIDDLKMFRATDWPHLAGLLEW